MYKEPLRKKLMIGNREVYVENIWQNEEGDHWVYLPLELLRQYCIAVGDKVAFVVDGNSIIFLPDFSPDQDVGKTLEKYLNNRLAAKQTNDKKD